MPNIQMQTRYFTIRLALLMAAAAAASVIVSTAVRSAVSLQSATTRPAADVQPLPLTERVLPASFLPGFVTLPPRFVVHSPLRWATTTGPSAAPADEAARLHRLGFVSGIDETLHGRFPLAAEVVSLVERYQSAAGARGELAYQRRLVLRNADSQKLTVLRPIGIPGAFAWAEKSRQLTGINVMFASGAYYYVVGSGAAPGTHGAPTVHQIVNAAQFVNLMANGCVAKPSINRTATGRTGRQETTAPRMLLH